MATSRKPRLSPATLPQQARQVGFAPPNLPCLKLGAMHTYTAH